MLSFAVQEQTKDLPLVRGAMDDHGDCDGCGCPLLPGGAAMTDWRKHRCEAACDNSGVPRRERDRILRFQRAVYRIDTCAYKCEIDDMPPEIIERGRIWATRLWNWIDHQPEPEPLWDFLMELCPWAFSDWKSPNSIIVTYPKAVQP